MTIDDTISSDLEVVPDIIEKWLGRLEPLRLSEDVIFGLKLCLQEAVINAIKHGNRGNPSLNVHVIIKAHPDRLTIEVTDQGKGFDFNAVPDPTAPENIGKNHGRGIYLIRQTMKEVTFLNSGRTIRMVMNRLS